MKNKMNSRLAGIAGVMLLTGNISARADGGKATQLDNLPAPAAAAIRQWANHEPIAGIDIEKEGGVAAYEAKVQGKDGATREITVDAKGKTLSEECTIALSSAPEAVRKAATTLAAGGKIHKVERILENGETTYELEIMKDGAIQEVVLTPGGKVKH